MFDFGRANDAQKEAIKALNEDLLQNHIQYNNSKIIEILKCYFMLFR